MKKVPNRLEDLLDQIEETLISEGLIPLEPCPRQCSGCGCESLDCTDYEGACIEGTFCRDCWQEVDRMESLIGETGKAVQRYFRDSARHFFFLEAGREPGKLVMITKEAVDTLHYFDPTGWSEENLRSRLRMCVTFS